MLQVNQFHLVNLHHFFLRLLKRFNFIFYFKSGFQNQASFSPLGAILIIEQVFLSSLYGEQLYQVDHAQEEILQFGNHLEVSH